MKHIIGKERRQEGDRYRLYSIIQCDDCGHTRYERKASKIKQVLEAPCPSCRSKERSRAKEQEKAYKAAQKAAEKAERLLAIKEVRAEKERLRAAARAQREWQKYYRRCRISYKARWQQGYSLEGLSSTYYAMMDRCFNENSASYPEWGGRGISVCLRWILEPFLFMEDMGPKPSPDHSLDRIDPNGDYEPGNCRWAVKEVQINNRRCVTSLLSDAEKIAVRKALSTINYFKRAYGDDWMVEGNLRCSPNW